MPTIPTRKLGRNGPDVSAIGFGCMGLSAFYGEVPSADEDRFAVLTAAVESGSTFIDTAHIYGDSEELIGRWLKANPGMRERIFLASKTGLEILPNGAGLKPRGETDFIKGQIDLALKKMGVDVIDLFYVHRIDSNVPIEETIQALKEYGIDAGKIRYIGLSEASADTIRRAHAVYPISAVQVEYSPFALEIEDKQLGVLDVCRELGIAVVAYSPLGRGLLTGRYKSRADFDKTDFRLNLPRFSEENFPKNLKLADKLQEVAKQKGNGVAASQVCLAWILSRGDDFFAIPGTKRVEMVKENNAAADVKLTDKELEFINQAIQDCKPAGTRYDEKSLKGLYADSAPKKQ